MLLRQLPILDDSYRMSIPAATNSHPPEKMRRGRWRLRALLGIVGVSIILFTLASLALPTFVNYGDVGTSYQLRRGIGVARTWAARHGGSYTGFDRVQAVATDAEGNVAWGLAANESRHPYVQIRHADGNTLLLVAFNTRGDPYCVADDLARGTSTGTVDGLVAGDCHGGWSWTDWKLPPPDPVPTTG